MIGNYGFGTVDDEVVVPTESFPTSSGTALLAESTVNNVFLATAIVFVTDRYGCKRECRAVLDSGSQVNFISRKFFKQLHLSSRKAKMSISGIGGGLIKSSSVLDIKVVSRAKDYSVSLPCYVLSAIVDDLPACPFSINTIDVSKEILDNLADLSFAKAGKIHFLIGRGSFNDILETKKISFGMDNIKLHDSKFGWISR